MTITARCVGKKPGFKRYEVRLQQQHPDSRVNSILFYDLGEEEAAAFQPGREYVLTVEERKS